MSPKKAAPEIMPFEKILAELNTIVDTMENQELTLEQSLTQFEKGITLTKQCHQALNEAKQKVAILCEQSAELKAFEQEDSATLNEE